MAMPQTTFHSTSRNTTRNGWLPAKYLASSSSTPFQICLRITYSWSSQDRIQPTYQPKPFYRPTKDSWAFSPFLSLNADGVKEATPPAQKTPARLCLGHSLSQNTSASPWSARRIFQSHHSPPFHCPQPLHVIHFSPPCDIYPSQQNPWHWVQQSPGVPTWP